MNAFVDWLIQQASGQLPASPAAPQIGGLIGGAPQGGLIDIMGAAGGIPPSPAAPQGMPAVTTPRSAPLTGTPGMPAAPVATGPRTMETPRTPPVVNAALGGPEAQPMPVPTAPVPPIAPMLDNTMGEAFLQNGGAGLGGPTNIVPEAAPGMDGAKLIEALKGVKPPEANQGPRLSTPSPEPLYRDKGDGLLGLLLGLARGGGGGGGGGPVNLDYLSSFLKR